MNIELNRSVDGVNTDEGVSLKVFAHVHAKRNTINLP